MCTLRVCIGSNDGEAVVQTHMGDTERFYIYDITKSGEVTLVDQRVNAARDDDEIGSVHASRAKMKAVMAILDDVHVFVATRNSPNFKRIAAGTKHQPVVVSEPDVNKALELLTRAFDEISALATARQSGTRDGAVLHLPSSENK